MDEFEKEFLRLIGIKVTWPRFRSEFKTENHVDRALDAVMSKLEPSKAALQRDAELAEQLRKDEPRG